MSVKAHSPGIAPILLLLSAGAQAGFDEYTITDLGSIVADTSSASNYSYAFDINDRGDVVGFSKGSDGIDHAVLWSRGQLIDLGTGRATSINSRRAIVGWGSGPDYLLWTPDGSGWLATDLGIAKSFKGQSVKINERGEIAGSSSEFDPVSGYDSVFFWKDGQLSKFGSASCLAQHIVGLNNSGDVWQEVGYGSVDVNLYHGRTGTTEDIESPPNGDTYEPVAMNDAGEAVGPGGPDDWISSGGYYSPKTGYRSLAMGVPLWDINNAGIAVGGGVYSNLNGGPPATTKDAVVAAPAENAYVKLQDQIPDFSGWQKLLIATAINDGGEIVGVGINAFGKTHAFLLRPIE